MSEVNEFLTKISKLNPDAGEIGDGMLHYLVETATALLAGGQSLEEKQELENESTVYSDAARLFGRLTDKSFMLEVSAAKLEARNKKLEALAINFLSDYDCPIGAVGVYVTEEAVAEHCQCAGKGWDEDTCPDCEECWKILISKNEVKDQ